MRSQLLFQEFGTPTRPPWPGIVYLLVSSRIAQHKTLDLSDVQQAAQRIKGLVKKVAACEGGKEAPEEIGLYWEDDE
jgi:hypothetical protein